MEASGNVVSAVPDMGQAYWNQQERLKAEEGGGIGLLLGIILLALFVALVSYGIWSDMPIEGGRKADGTRSVTTAGGMLILGGMLLAVLGGPALYFGIDRWISLRRLRRTMPPRPAHYAPAIARVAYHLEDRLRLRAHFIAKRNELGLSIGNLSNEIDDDIQRIDAYRKVMAEEDIDVLTLHS